MTESEHLEMLGVMQSHKGPAVLSGYDNSVLSDWQQVSVKPPKVEKAAVRIEKLWVKP